jgi:hypothetical protein
MAGAQRDRALSGLDRRDELGTAFTAVLVVTFAAYRISSDMPTGLRIVDRLLAPRSTFNALRILLVMLAIGAGFMTFRSGDLGAKAVWAGRLQAARRGSEGPLPSGPARP